MLLFITNSLLVQIPLMFGETRETETVLGPVIQAGMESLKVFSEDNHHLKFLFLHKNYCELGPLLILTLYTIISFCIFSILFAIHLLWCWQGEFV